MKNIITNTSTRNIMTMRDEIKDRYGADSYEFGWAQFVFANRDTEYFLRVYDQLMAA